MSDLEARARPDSPGPHLSVVIPVFNEEAILRAAVLELRDSLQGLDRSYEILLAENGSRDATLELARALTAEYPEVRLLSVPEPNYGRALRAGLLSALGEIVLCEEIDLCDAGFHARAVGLLEADAADLVIGSKLLAGSRDQRPWLRHAASLGYTALLRLLLGFPGTDTHGLKAFRRSALLPIVEACVVDRDVFASELVIRAYRARLKIQEIPVNILEKRPPSIRLARRVPQVVKNLARLTWAIHCRGR